MALIMKHKFSFCPNLSRNKFCDAIVRARDSDRLISVHKVFLAAASRTFENMFDGSPCKDKIYVVADVTFHTLKQIVDYIYTGETLLETEDDYKKFCVGLVVLRIDLGVVERIRIKAVEEETGEYLEANNNNDLQLKTELETSVDICTEGTSQSGDSKGKVKVLAPNPGVAIVVETHFDNSLDVNKNNDKGKKRKCDDEMNESDINFEEVMSSDTIEFERSAEMLLKATKNSKKKPKKLLCTQEYLGCKETFTDQKELTKHAGNCIHKLSINSQRVLIRISGSVPDQLGTQIIYPLSTLQALRPGQALPAGKQEHVLTRLQTGRYQVPGPCGRQAASPVQIQAPTPSCSLFHLTSTVPGANASTTFSRKQMMTPAAAMIKCKNFLQTLLRLSADQGVSKSVHALIQSLIDGQEKPETFTTKLHNVFNSSPQPCRIPFLKKSLPFLQQALAHGELTIAGTIPPFHMIKMVPFPPPYHP